MQVSWRVRRRKCKNIEAKTFQYASAYLTGYPCFIEKQRQNFFKWLLLELLPLDTKTQALHSWSYLMNNSSNLMTMFLHFVLFNGLDIAKKRCVLPISCSHFALIRNNCKLNSEVWQVINYALLSTEPNTFFFLQHHSNK